MNSKRESPWYSSEGIELNQYEIQQLKDKHKMMRNYPKLLLLDVGQKGKEDVNLELSRKKQLRIDELVDEFDKKLVKNVSENLN
jgi:hypothetical protein